MCEIQGLMADGDIVTGAGHTSLCIVEDFGKDKNFAD